MSEEQKWSPLTGHPPVSIGNRGAAISGPTTIAGSETLTEKNDSHHDDGTDESSLHKTNEMLQEGMIPHHFNNRTLAFYLNSASLARPYSFMERSPGYDYYLLGGLFAVFLFLLLILIFIRCSIVHLPIMLGYSEHDVSRSSTAISIYSFDPKTNEAQLLAYANKAYCHSDFQPSVV